MKTILYVFSFFLLFIIPNFSKAQFFSVSGYITSSVTERGIENASVFENVTGIGTISNNNGYYRLLLNPGKAKLIISRPGFETFSTAFELKKDTIISPALNSEPFPGRKIVVENDSQKKGDSIKTKVKVSNAVEK
jgi:hypothetical protein